jgi:hypothetical protein
VLLLNLKKQPLQSFFYRLQKTRLCFLCLHILNRFAFLPLVPSLLFHHLVYLPLQYLELLVLATRQVLLRRQLGIACKTSREVTCRTIRLIGPIPNLQIITSAKSRPETLKTTNRLVPLSLRQCILLFLVYIEQKSLMVLICLKKSPVILKVLRPRQRRIPTDDLVALCLAYCQCVSLVVAKFVEFLC